MAESQHKSKDYYQILGVVRSATCQEIERAFRNLARKWHPDVCQDTRAAAAHFKQIAKAYETLGDPEKRRRYDRSQVRRPPVAAPAVWPTRVTPQPPAAVNPFASEWLARPLDELLHGWFAVPPGRHQIDLGIRQARPDLDVQADLPLTPEEARQGGPVEFSVSFQQRCPRCRGTATATGEVCRACGGSGSVQQGPRRVTIHVPPGSGHGSVIRVPGAGKVMPAAECPGDLYLRLQIRPCW